MDVFTLPARWHSAASSIIRATLAALEHVCSWWPPRKSITDQGVQYAATAYVERGPTSNRAWPAIGEPRERLRRTPHHLTIKEEEVDLSEYTDFADAHRQIALPR